MKVLKKVLTLLKVRKLVILFLYFSGIYALRNLIFKKKGIFILFYHRLEKRKTSEVFPFLAIDIDNFIKHIEYLKKKYEVISMDEAYELLRSNKELHKDYFVVTFDDGYRDNYTYGFDIFKKYGIKPTIYLAANNIENQKYLWVDMVAEIVYSSKANKVFVDMLGKEVSLGSLNDRTNLLMSILAKLKQYEDKEKYKKIDSLSATFNTAVPKECKLMMNWEDANNLSELGVDIGSHTMNHPILTKILPEEAKDELEKSKELIEKRIGKSVNNFAYPNGRKTDYDSYVKEEAAKLYKTSVTTLFGANNPGDDLHELKRIGIGPGVSLTDFKFLIQNARIKLGRSKS
ncbi:MAG TPA: polysaccharide deacetylase family protein [Clostridia bacterium]